MWNYLKLTEINLRIQHKMKMKFLRFYFFHYSIKHEFNTNIHLKFLKWQKNMKKDYRDQSQIFA